MTGTALPSFADLGTPAPIAAALRREGIDTPFPIQRAAVPVGLTGRDLCGKAPTGSGKTIAFSIVLATRCPEAQVGRPTGLVLTPTRELAEQVAAELRLVAAPMGLTVRAAYGGVPITRDLKAYQRRVDLLVACPGRLLDLIERGAVHLSHVAVAVIDEADRMADMGFLPDVRALIKATPEDRQTLLFSATLDGDVDVLIRQHQRNPQHVEVERSEADQAVMVDHHVWDVRRDRRLDTAADVLCRWSSAIVFTRTRHGADRVAEQLQKRGITCVALHGDKSQAQRDRALERFRDGEVRALVATDVAARGIHVDHVAGVLQYDVPTDHKDYTHRAGRTGRAGEPGVVVTLVMPESRTGMQRIIADLGGDAELVPVSAEQISQLGPAIAHVAPPPAPQPARQPGSRPGPKGGRKRPSGVRGSSSGRGGTKSAGSKSSGPKSSGPKSSGPKGSGPKGSGPKGSGPKGSGPKAGGPTGRRTGPGSRGRPPGPAGSASPKGPRRSR